MSSKRQRERKARRIELRRLGFGPPLVPLRVADPLLAHDRELGLKKGIAVLAFAMGAHAIVVGGFFGMSELADRYSWFEPERESIEVAVVEAKIEEPPPPPPPPEVIEPPEPPPPPPKKKTKPPPPPPDPIDLPPEEPPEPEEPPPESVVGLDAESTVEGGSGPKFAAGNTRMGQTDNVAQDPNAIEELPKTGVVPEPVIVPPKRKGAMTEPEYPIHYREQQIEGSVVVRVVVDEQGRVTAAEIASPSPHREFNRAAEKAAKRDKYEPATRNGIPVQYAFTVKYTFRLTD
jgi:protein TonB